MPKRTKPSTKPAFEPITHTFPNGEEITFKAANQRMKKHITLLPDDAGVTVDFMFQNGSMQSLTVDATHKNHWMFTGHGASQKIGDAATGRNIETVEDAEMAVQRMIAQTAEQWNMKREGGGDRLTLVVRAFARLKEIDAEEAKAKIASMSEDQLKQLRNLDVVKTTIEKIKFEDQKAKLENLEEGSTDDLDSLLETL